MGSWHSSINRPRVSVQFSGTIFWLDTRNVFASCRPSCYPVRWLWPSCIDPNIFCSEYKVHLPIVFVYFCFIHHHNYPLPSNSLLYPLKVSPFFIFHWSDEWLEFILWSYCLSIAAVVWLLIESTVVCVCVCVYSWAYSGVRMKQPLWPVKWNKFGLSETILTPKILVSNGRTLISITLSKMLSFQLQCPS